MSSFQRLDYLTTGLPHEAAAEIWRGVVGPLFEPRAFHPGQQSPTGSASGAVIGDIMVARVVFGAQSYRRDRDLIARTPDHILFHLYNVGGFNGRISGHQTTIWSAQVAIIDLAQEVETLAASSDTVALIVVDCLTLWLTNWLMPAPAPAPVSEGSEPNRPPAHDWLGQCAMFLGAIRQSPGPVVLVGNEIGLGVIPMGREVRAFVDALGSLNQRVAEACQRVTLVAAGLPLTLKDTP